MANVIATYKKVEIWRDAMGHTCCIHPVLGHRVERRNLADIKRNIDMVSELVNEGLLTPGSETNQAWLNMVAR